MPVKCIFCGKEAGHHELGQCVACGAYQCDRCPDQVDWRCCERRMDSAVDACIEQMEEMLASEQ